MVLHNGARHGCCRLGYKVLFRLEINNKVGFEYAHNMFTPDGIKQALIKTNKQQKAVFFKKKKTEGVTKGSTETKKKQTN